jgi:putative transcriptional regulator
LIRHHPSEATLVAYAAGSLPEALAVVAAVHIGRCVACRRSLTVLEAAGGALLDALPPVPLADDALARLLSRVDGPTPAPLPILNPGLPAPLDRVALGRWWRIGRGIRWRALRASGAAWGGLIQVQPGRALPRHGHAGLELTCVLSGSFADGAGRYEAGDLAESEGDHDEPPLATGAQPCLCIVALEGVRLRGLLGLAQRMLGIS